MKKVTFKLEGEKQEKAAEAIFTWIIDGGGEDIVRDILEINGIIVRKFGFDPEKREITMETGELDG